MHVEICDVQGPVDFGRDKYSFRGVSVLIETEVPLMTPLPCFWVVF